VRTILPILAAAALCLAQETTAEKLIEAGHWKRARAVVEQRLRQAPQDADANYLLSQIRAAFGDRTSPLELATTAVRLDGGVARYHRQLAEVQGVMAQHANLFQQALLARRFRKEIDTALSLDPRDMQALRDLIEYYLMAPGILGGDTNKAEAVARQIAALDAVEGLLAGARIAEFRKDSTRTEALLQRAAKLRPPSYKAQMALAWFYLAPEHRDDAAAEALGKGALGLDGGRAEAYCVLAVSYADRANWSALETLLSSAAQAVPDDAAPYYRAADRLLTSGREPARSERYLRAYLARDPEGNQPTVADAHWKLGLALRAQGREAEAAREWRTALQLDPESPAARELKASRTASTAD
jgi:tetratricopeptide (TPR) repeat protein